MGATLPLLLRSTGSSRAGSVVVAHGSSCSAACGIFPDQGSNPCPLHWQADSQPLRHQGSPHILFLILSSIFQENHIQNSHIKMVKCLMSCKESLKHFIIFIGEIIYCKEYDRIGQIKIWIKYSIYFQVLKI